MKDVIKKKTHNTVREYINKIYEKKKLTVGELNDDDSRIKLFNYRDQLILKAEAYLIDLGKKAGKPMNNNPYIDATMEFVEAEYDRCIEEIEKFACNNLFPTNGTYSLLNKKFIIKCKDGYIEIFDIQIEGKKRMPVSDFINGLNTQNVTGILE